MVSNLDVDVKVLDSRVKDLPQYQTQGSVGMDLRTLDNLCIPPDTYEIINTGIAIDIKNPLVAGFIYPRSSLGPVRLSNTVGVIDSDYQGEIIIKLYNPTNEAYLYDAYQRVAQIVFQPVYKGSWNIVDEFEERTERGSGGFGHTGK